jgi:hypothetical protein
MIEYTESEQELYWKRTGEFFGYPPCCIDSFLRGERTSLQEWTSEGTGFIPCHEHAEEIECGMTTLDELIGAHRKCPVPFPQGLRWFEEMMKRSCEGDDW